MARRSSKNKYSNIATLLVIAGLAVLVFVLVKVNKKKVTFIKYPAFGIEVPANYAIHGIDVSRYQKDINWQQVKDMQVEHIKMGFAFMKATEGETSVDPRFRDNWKDARKRNITRGAYHFFLPNKDAALQAKSFIRQVKLESGDLPPVLDIEVLNGVRPDMLRSKIAIWLDLVEKQYKVKPIIYTNADFYTKNLGEGFDEYPLWVAHYFEKKRPRINRDWSFWQHSDQGNVDGIDAKVDFNVFNGDSTKFRALLVP